MTAQENRKQLRTFADPEKAKLLQGFLKTGPGEYGEGDKFLGIVLRLFRPRSFRGPFFIAPKIALA